MENEKRYVITESQLNGLGEIVKELPLKYGMALWNRLKDLADTCEWVPEDTTGPAEAPAVAIELPKEVRRTKRAQR